MLPTPDEIEQVLASFSPDETALLEWLQPQMDDRLLSEIAAADYGRDYDQHYQPLRAIRNTLIIPAPLDWYPGEVLEALCVGQNRITRTGS
jgi:hypothetical protein